MNASIHELQSHLLSLWINYKVNDSYQNIFLAYLGSLKDSSLQVQQIEAQIKKTYQKSSLYFLLVQNMQLRSQIKVQIKEQLQKQQKLYNKKFSIQIILSSICTKLKNLRRINLLTSQTILKILQTYVPSSSINHNYIPIFIQLDADNNYLKQSFLSAYILFERGYDPFFMAHYQQVMKSSNTKALKQYQPVKDLFDMNITFVYRLMRAQKKMLKYMLHMGSNTDDQAKQFGRQIRQNKFTQARKFTNSSLPQISQFTQKRRASDPYNISKIQTIRNYKPSHFNRSKSYQSNKMQDDSQQNLQQKVHERKKNHSLKPIYKSQLIDSQYVESSFRNSYVINPTPKNLRLKSLKDIQPYQANILKSSPKIKQGKQKKWNERKFHHLKLNQLKSRYPLNRQAQSQFDQLSYRQNYFSNRQSYTSDAESNLSKVHHKQRVYDFDENNQTKSNKLLKPTHFQGFVHSQMSKPKYQTIDHQQYKTNKKNDQKRYLKELNQQSLDQSDVINEQSQFSNSQSNSQNQQQYQVNAQSRSQTDLQDSQQGHQKYPQKSSNKQIQNQNQPSNNYSKSKVNKKIKEIKQNQQAIKPKEKEKEKKKQSLNPSKESLNSSNQSINPSKNSINPSKEILNPPNKVINLQKKSINLQKKIKKPEQNIQIKGALIKPQKKYKPKQNRSAQQKEKKTQLREESQNQTPSKNTISVQKSDRQKFSIQQIKRPIKPSNQLTDTSVTSPKVKVETDRSPRLNIEIGTSPKVKEEAIPSTKIKDEKLVIPVNKPSVSTIPKNMKPPLPTSNPTNSQIKMVPGKFNIQDIQSYFKGKNTLNTHKKALQEFLKGSLNFIKQMQTYLSQFIINDQLAVLALCSPNLDGNIQLLLWMPIQSVCDLKKSFFFFKKYISYLQAQTTLKKIIYKGEILPQLQQQGFKLTQGNVLIRGRILPLTKSPFQLQSFLSLQLSSICFPQISIQSLLYSDEITAFNKQNYWVSQFIHKQTKVPKPIQMEFTCDKGVKGLTKANQLLEKQGFDTFQVGQQNQVIQTGVQLTRTRQKGQVRHNFIVKDGYFIVDAKICHHTNSNQIKIAKIQLSSGINLYLGKSFQSVAQMVQSVSQIIELVRKDKTKKLQKDIKCSFKMFSKQIYGKYINQDSKAQRKHAYGNWQVNFAWRDQISGIIIHDPFNSDVVFGPQNFICLIQKNNILICGVQITSEDFLT